MPQDLYIDLPSGVRSDTIPLKRTLEPRAEDLLQRAVTLLLLSNDPEFLYEGDSVLRLFRKSTSAVSGEAREILGPIGDALKQKLNADYDQVESVVFEFGEAAAEQQAKLTITVTKYDGEAETSILV